MLMLRLNRSRTLDVRALLVFANYLTRHPIDILHAHSSAVFICLIVTVLPKSPQIVWHLHQGKLAERSHAPMPMRLASRRVAAVITVSRPLADWAIEKLQIPPQKVSYIPNYIRKTGFSQAASQLPGSPGFRIVSVGNFRTEKDTFTLLSAMTQILCQYLRRISYWSAEMLTVLR
jgi:glycosyltransferase involved in cell wall biosynthesis